MSVRGLTLGLPLAIVSVAQAGVMVELVPDAAGPYSPGQVVMVDVQLVQTQPGTTNPCTAATCDSHLLRMIQFDLAASDPDLTIDLPLTHDLNDVDSSNDIRFWFFGSLAACVSSPEICGEGYFIVDDPSGGIPPGPKHISATFGSETHLDESVLRQLLLPDDGSPVKVGELQVTLPDPAPNPTYTLDVLNENPAGTDPDVGGQVRWGFGLSGGADPITAWRGDGPAPEVTGGTLDFPVGPVCGNNVTEAGEDCDGTDDAACPGLCQGDCTCPVTLANLIPAQSVPLCDKSLWRSANNIVRLTFDADITAPGPGEVLIQQLDPVNPGGFLGDLSGSFSFAVENDGGGNPRVLRINETVSALTHLTWVAVRNTGGWADAAPFEVDYKVLVGDVNDDGRILSTDVGAVNLLIPCFVGCGDDNRADVNGDGRILSTDVGTVNLNIPVFNLPKPGGHACFP